MRIYLSHYGQRASALACGLLLMFSAALAQPASQVLGRFAGNWAEDQSKTKTGAMRSLTFRKGADGLEELRGSYANPLVQPVRFNTAPYPVDGSKNTLVWKQLGGGRFERTIAENGKTISVRHITVSSDGKTLTEMTEANLAGGKKSTSTIVYSRASGAGQTLEGEWKPQSFKSDTPGGMSIESAGNTLKISTESGEMLTLSFDGNPAAVAGPAVVTGTTAAGKIVGDRMIEISGAQRGTATVETTWTLSADGKTLTASTMTFGPEASKEPSVIVYMKQ